MAKLLFEVFDEFVAAESREDKINVLRRNDSWPLKNILKGTFDPNVQFTIKVPEYKRSDVPDGMSYSSIHHEISRAYLFEAGNPKVPPTLSDRRKEEILIQILEVLEAREAEIFAAMIEKKNIIPGLTADLIAEAFPGLL